MRSVELVPGIQSSALGFGCASVLGSIDGKTARRAIDCAIDCGITHFDLARSYGYGQAEEFVGKILRKRRYSFVLASKFGIRANWKAIGLTPLKPLIRWIRSTQPSQKMTAGTASNSLTHADRFHDRVPLRAPEMSRSVEKSLRTLRIDYLDYLFVHEPPGRLIHIDELVETANQLKAQGKVRAFGLALTNAQKPLHQSYLSQFDLLQVDCPREESVYRALVAERGLASNVLFSVMKAGPVAMEPLNKLRLISQDFANSVILCSMFREEHIIANARALD